jgi:hypothetical protein
MTLEEIQNRIEEIRQKSYDDEAARDMEDALREDSIRWIAEVDGIGFEQKAKLVLTTNNIEFERWTA